MVPGLVTALGSGGVVGVATGLNNTCAVKSDGTLWCWGFAVYFESPSTRGTPQRVTPLGNDVAEVSTGFHRHTCARKLDRSLWCWGWGTYGQLGDGSTPIERKEPAPVTALGLEVAGLALGSLHSCALKIDGTVWCWGYGYYGQLGDGAGSQRNVPVQVTSMTDAVQVAAGGHFTCALRMDGTVWCWGRNEAGQLGDGLPRERVLTPTRVSCLGGVVDIAAGGVFACARKRDETLWCWGSNSRGGLGAGIIDAASATPMQVVMPDERILNVAAGVYHACAATTGGTWCWGENLRGALGDGTKVNRSAPVPVAACP